MSIFTRAFWNATGERMVRGGVAALVAVYLSGNTVFDVTHVSDSLQHIVVLFVGGAFSALALSMGIHVVRRNGPALNGSENLTEAPPVRNQAGQINVAFSEICMIVLTVVVVLWWFGVRPG